MLYKDLSKTNWMVIIITQSRWRDLNSRHTPYEGGILTTVLHRIVVNYNILYDILLPTSLTFIQYHDWPLFQFAVLYKS